MEGSCILMSHLGRPKSGPEDKFSLKHIIPNLSEKLGVDVKFADDCVGQSAADWCRICFTIRRSTSFRKRKILFRRN